MRGQDLLMRMPMGSEEGLSQTPNQKPRKTGQGQRNPEPDLSPPGLPIISRVTLNESLNLSGLFPDKEELESLLR